MRHLLASIIALVVVASSAAADTTPQPLPFTQAWTDATQITADDNWSGVPGVEGYLGQNITTVTASDPQTLLTESAVANDVTVLANQGTASSTAGDVGEFHGGLRRRLNIATFGCNSRKTGISLSVAPG